MNRQKTEAPCGARWSATFGGALMLILVLAGCTDSEGGGNACQTDDQCERGAICQQESCTAIACTSLNDCPGSGRTCLADLDRCSQNECAATIDGLPVSCEAGQTCLESGPNRGTCLDGCTVDGECSDGNRCCGGACRDDCPEADRGMLPVVDADVDQGPVADAGPDAGGDTGVTPDQGMMGGTLCAPCGRVADCAPLGAGASCTPIGNTGSFCTSACQGPADCPDGFTCLQNVQQCVPANYDCTTCPATPCPGGEVCDVATGTCVPPRQACEPCTGDESCAPGLRCDQAGGQAVCLSECPGGNCPAGYACEGGLCRPAGGACDACDGACVGATPVCLQAEARCVQCDALNPCQGDRVCDANNTCVEPGGGCDCVTDNDCGACFGLPICFRGRCVACLDDSECPPRFACNANQQCERAPCRGVNCQAGAQCDPVQGLCVNGQGQPACRAAADCALPDVMGCNVGTGQCYYLNGRCDPPGGDGVCAPGATCNAVIPELSSCTCRRQDPLATPPGPELVSCQPGGTCIHGEAFPPGSGMAAPEGFCLHFGF